MKKSVFFVVLLTLLCSAVFCGCQKSTVKVALMTKLQSGSIVGSSEVNAAKLFAEKTPNTQLEIIPFDDAWDAGQAVKVYNELRSKGINILVTSHVSTCAVAIMDLVNRDKVFTFVTGATTDALSGKNDYIFRNVQDVRSEQKSIAQYVKGQNPGKLLIIRDVGNPAYTEPALKFFREEYGTGDVRLLEVDVSKMDIQAIQKDMLSKPFDTLYLLVGSYKAVAGSLGQLAYKLNPRVKIIYTPWMKTPVLLETAGESLQISVVPSHYPPRAESSAINKYFEEFKQRFSFSPTFISLNVYTALEILDQAIKAGSRSPDQIRTYFLSKKSFETSFGPVIFDEYGDTQKKLFFIKDVTKEF